ncbi:tRNA (uridine(54)-C5)-methyltransferase TrmA [Campylobacter corcagiensis]|uniref:tRNA (Uridine(54)-C5)-methyltransferase TrmA n=1 Tax=Campylobacter corcagiensis TaxID=1448857 RepID=A0A7M1LF17_9BACT|nr:tRNA (uridine(54)-C5)-methyltransferase TrmA [Campylobacter corcagiensis]QKF64808.1 tRNA m5U54 methyltransferase [Campylobacter corcagiensis]QOQ87030.1 tRNA (uridine(54)-C5)-methyltransferase TrmA [Campylobacter corcagiensis]
MKNSHCKHLKECASCTFDTSYDEQIGLKKDFIASKFSKFYKGEFKVFRSKTKHYRCRAEFGIYHENDRLSYTMNGLNTKYLKIDECPKVDEKIANLMPNLLKNLEKDEKLKFKLFGVEFVATSSDILAILLYHKDINSIKDELLNLAKILDINLIARSRGKKLVFGSEILNDTLNIKDKIYHYKFESGAFLQPNKAINEAMISFISDNIKAPKDLLEMYCGHGNFTIPLSFKFRRVLANEISKSSIKNATLNCELNGVSNINFLRMSSEELIRAFGGESFRRLSGVNLNEFDFSHILVDPPRAGLDKSVINFIKNHENIIYISCNPLTLEENLNDLCKTHEVINFAIFDQFVHTKHIECGVILRRKDDI